MRICREAPEAIHGHLPFRVQERSLPFAISFSEEGNSESMTGALLSAAHRRTGGRLPPEVNRVLFVK